MLLQRLTLDYEGNYVNYNMLRLYVRCLKMVN